MPIYDFACDGGHLTEAIRPMACEVIACRCGRDARRTGVNPGIGVVGPTTDTRGMFRRYQEASAEMEDRAQRFERETGQAAPDNGLWRAAKQRAAAIERAGENPLRPIRETT